MATPLYRACTLRDIPTSLFLDDIEFFLASIALAPRRMLRVGSNTTLSAPLTVYIFFKQ